MTRSLISIIRILIVLIIVATAVLMLVPNAGLKARAAWYYANGRGAGCSLASIVAAADDTYVQVSEPERLRNASTVIRRDGPLSLVRTPKGELWAPSDSVDALAYDMAEQGRSIYGDVSGGDVVLDCGANIGLYTKYAVERQAGMVVAIEPSPENLECLRRNLAPEISAGRVRVYPKGVWDKQDHLEFSIQPGNTAANSFVRQYEGSRNVIVPVTTVDDIVAELGLTRVHLIKMDIEGAERRALAGARRTITRFLPRLEVCVYHLPDDPKVLPALVTSISPRYSSECGCLLGTDSVLQQVAHLTAR